MTCPECGAAMMNWFTQGRIWYSCRGCHDVERKNAEAQNAAPGHERKTAEAQTAEAQKQRPTQ